MREAESRLPRPLPRFRFFKWLPTCRSW